MYGHWSIMHFVTQIFVIETDALIEMWFEHFVDNGNKHAR